MLQNKAITSKFHPLTIGEGIEKLKENFQRVTSVMAAHQIALWECDLVAGKCNFADDYFRILGLEQVGVVFADPAEFGQFVHLDDISIMVTDTFWNSIEFMDKTSRISVCCIGVYGEI